MRFLPKQGVMYLVKHHLQRHIVALLLTFCLYTFTGVHGTREDTSFNSATQWLRYSRDLGARHSAPQKDLRERGRLLAGKKISGDGERPLASSQCRALQEVKRWLQPKSWANSTNSSKNESLSCNCSAWHGVTCNRGGQVVAFQLRGARGSLPGRLSGFNAVTSLVLDDCILDKSSSGQLFASLPSLRSLIINGSFSDKPHFQDLIVLSSLTSLRRIRIQDAGFQGAFPEELSALRSLSALEVVGNSLSIIPDWLSSVTSLRKLTITRADVYQALPAHLGSLPGLERLDLSDNDLWSSIPPGLFNASSLQDLNLSSNNLEGSIPQAVSTTARLTQLDLSSNRLSGKLPQGVFWLPLLRRLVLNSNLLRGPWPSTVGEARSLRELYLDENRFTGSFPSSLLELSALEIVSLSRNRLQGSIPEGVSRMRSLKVAVLHNNSLSGTLDPLASMPWLKVLVLSNNSFSGILPSRLSDLRNLSFAMLDGNQLEGPFPTFFASLERLQGLSISRNQFSGPLPPLTRWVGQFLDLGYNNFTGSLPHLSLVHQLQYISLARNQLSGSLDVGGLSSLTGLKRVSLRGNKFTGAIPDMSAFPHLEWLDLAYNNLTQANLSVAVPLRALRFLDLSGNQISSFPTALAAVANLTYLGLARNGLNGGIPSALADLQQLAVLRLESNGLSGGFPPSLCQLPRLSFLSLRNNAFYGWLPPCLFNMPRLQGLDLGNNLFFGPGPASFASAPRFLALENNFFSGRLPMYIQGEPFCPLGTGQGEGRGQSVQSFYWNDYPGPVLRYTGVSSLAGNCFAFAGRWCTAGVLFEQQRNRTQCFKVCSSNRSGMMCGGHGVCLVGAGSPPSFTCKCDKGYESASANESVTCVPEPPPQPPDTGLPLAGLVGVIVTGVLSIAVIVLACIILRRKPQVRRRWNDLDVCQEFTLQEIEKATESWAPKNLLGQGGYGVVYLGRSPKGELWAVKRAKLMTNDFEKEVRAMASLNHPNLVRLLGFSLHYDVATACQEQILVYEYVAGGDLRRRMQDVDVPLSLGQRLSIAIGAAEGLAYLHSFDNPIVHRDVKAANILLEPAGEVGDEMMRAKVADFGLLKKLSGDDATRLAGTPGYMDPEYFKTQTVTPRVDVYSFGVLLLELITGTPAVSEERHLVGGGGSGHIVGMCLRLFEDSRADELLDSSLEAPEEAVLELTLVAVDCVRVPGMARPSMSDVAARLKGLQRRFEGQLDEFACSSCSDFESAKDI